MTTNKKIKVIIIDDEKLAREIISSYLKKFDNVELVAECSDGFEGIKQINELKRLVKSVEKRNEFLDRVIIKSGQKIQIIPIEAVHYIEAQDDYTMLYTEKGNFLKQKTMK